jgi:hypothetical protein
MRHLLPAFFVIATVSAMPFQAMAQSALVDLSKPQAGKSRFVFNPNLTPASLGTGETEEAAMIDARAPACGVGCKMDQPELPKPVRAAYGREPGSYQSGNRTRVYIVAAGGSSSEQKTAQQPAKPRKTFRFRRR